MSAERPPLFDTSSLLPFGEKADIIRAYEEARAKDAELIQQLVDALDMVLKSSALERGNNSVYMGDRNSGCVHFGNQAISSAAAAGFKPSKP